MSDVGVDKAGLGTLGLCPLGRGFTVLVKVEEVRNRLGFAEQRGAWGGSDWPPSQMRCTQRPKDAFNHRANG